MRSVNRLVPRRLAAAVGTTVERRRRGLVASVVVGIGLTGGLAGELPAAVAHANSITLVLPDGTQMPIPVLEGGSAGRPGSPAGAHGATSPAAATPTAASPEASASPGGGGPGGRKPLSILSMPAAPAAGVPPPVVAKSTAQVVTGRETGPAAAPGGAPFGTLAPKPAPVDRAAAVARPGGVVPATTGLRAPDGLPTAVDPTLSIGLPAPAPVGVTSFFVDHFDVPPFLLPIFQAAGTRYQVPWQVLAAINQIETDYGRNLSVSTAGAAGWMQILPRTFRAYGVDANGTGVKDPYNPADAIFTAARILHAAGASENLRRAIFAYNHAHWYVDSVMLRARLIGGLPPELVGSVTGLADGVFPISAAVRYADDVAEAAALAVRSGASSSPAGAKHSTRTSAIRVYAAAGSSVVAVKAGLITAIGSSPTRGRYVHLRDAYGNTYVYSQLGQLAANYATASPADPQLATFGLSASGPILPVDPPPQAPATAGHQVVAPTPAPTPAPSVVPTGAPPVAGAQVPGRSAPTLPVATDTAAGPQRLFANPTLPSSFAAGGQAQLASRSPSPAEHTTNPAADGIVLEPLVAGIHIPAGTVLGQIGPRTATQASHMSFQIRPGGRKSPYVDPKPILDGWQLLQTTSGHPAAGASALFGPVRAASLDKIGWETSAELEAQVLANPSIVILPEVRRAIEAGLLGQPALAALEYLAAAGLRPTVSGVPSGSPPITGLPGNAGPIPAAAPGAGLEISALNGVPVLGHDGAGSITDIAIRQLLGLPAGLRPLEINGRTTYSPGEAASATPGHADRIALAFAPGAGGSPVLGQLGDPGLTPPQWLKLIDHLDGLNNPTVANGPPAAGVTGLRGP